MQEDENEPPKDKVEPDDCGEKEERRSYYYDDAHGYEDFDPETEEDTGDDDQLKNVS
jgi:hypothetical protein